MIIPVIVGICTGILSGFGIGGGSLLILYLIIIVDLPQHSAAGINLLYFIFCAPFALINHSKNHLIDKQTLIYCSISGIVAAILSAFLAQTLSPNFLKRLFGIMLLYIGIKELFYKKK